jgi:nodulation protein F
MPPATSNSGLRQWYLSGGKQLDGSISGTGAMADRLATEIIDKIKAHADPDGNEITVDTELTELGIHSLELTEIVFDLEEAYGIEIEMNTVEAWNKLKNVSDIIEATRALIAAKG